MTNPADSSPANRAALLLAEAAKRILVLDGAMGTEIQGLGFRSLNSAASVSRAANAISRATTTF